MRSLQAKILELIDAGRRFAVATVAEARGSVPGKPGAKMILLPDGTQHGTVGGAGLEEKVKGHAARCLRTGSGGLFSFTLNAYTEGGLDSLCGGGVTVMIEVHRPAPHLLIAGGGHCGLEVARLCDQLGYAYSVLDDREEYASEARFPRARHRMLQIPADLSPYTHAVLLGWSHKVDTDLLYDLVGRFSGWIGVISSRAKRTEMFRRLRARGIEAEALDRVVAPVGLPIGAESPAEIAVSILAQVIESSKRGTPVAAAGGKPAGTAS